MLILEQMLYLCKSSKVNTRETLFKETYKKYLHLQHVYNRFNFILLAAFYPFRTVELVFFVCDLYNE